MKYENTVEASFIKRINRFTAAVLLEGKEELVHVKNTGRLRELLIEQAPVCLQKAANPNRKTRYDLISVWKDDLGWVNIDSQVCNDVVEEYLSSNTNHSYKREVRHGNSRFDFLLDNKIFVEVKGCTLIQNQTGLFPDAPTVRGVKHVLELTNLAKEGREVWIIFVIAVNDIPYCQANASQDPAFFQALALAKEAGVHILHASCSVGPDHIQIMSLCEKGN